MTIKFTVSNVTDGDTFQVEGGWNWGYEKTGTKVRPTGYNTPEKGEKGYEAAKKELKDLIDGKEVEISNPKTIDTYGRLVADVKYNGKYLKDYFPEY